MRSTNIALSIPVDLLDRIEAAAELAGVSRAAWVKQACKFALVAGQPSGSNTPEQAEVTLDTEKPWLGLSNPDPEQAVKLKEQLQLLRQQGIE